MANIDQYLDEIEVASRGEEVRDSIINAFEALNSEGPGTMDWDNITDTPDTLTGYGVSEVPASMVSGVLALNNIPPSALERVVPVADDTARFALTSSDVQNGDTVKVLSTLKLYLVVDDTSLSTEAGYEEYKAGTADSVDWSGVLNTPDTLAGYGIEDAYTKDEVDDITTSEEVESDEGNPIVIETDAAQYAKNTHLTLEPVQDLHGYDHPWPAGGGKNLLPMTVAGIKANNPSQTWNGNVWTVNNGTITILTDSSDNVIGIKANGTFSSRTVVYLVSKTNSIGLASGNYILSKGGTSAQVVVDAYNGSSWIKNLASSYGTDVVNFTIDNDGYDRIEVFISIADGVTLSNVVLYPMIRLASVSDATFEPYSNICPITGVDEVEVRATGKNLLNVNDTLVGKDANYSNNSSRAIIDIVCKPNETYTFSCGSGVVENIYLFERTTSGEAIKNTAVPQERVLTITTTATSGRIIVQFNKTNILLSDITGLLPQLELGSQATTYEPYTEYTASLNLPEEVYSGTLDLETGELTVDKLGADLGDYEWSMYSVTQGTLFRTAFPNFNPEYNARNYVLSDYPVVYASQRINKTSSVGSAGNVDIIDSDYSTQAAFKAAMKGQTIVYSLATPVTYQLTPQQLALFKGTNNVSTNAKTVQVTYRNGELATTGNIVDAVEVAKQNAIGESASYTDARLATELAPILGNFASAETSPASASHAVGEYLLYNNRLFKVLAAISAGQQLAIGTNIGQTNVAAELASLNGMVKNIDVSVIWENSICDYADSISESTVRHVWYGANNPDAPSNTQGYCKIISKNSDTKILIATSLDGYVFTRYRYGTWQSNWLSV